MRYMAMAIWGLVGICTNAHPASAVLEEDDTPVGAGGGCHITDGQGNGYWQWWHQDVERTENCPIRCGTSGAFGGYGRTERYTDEGEWNMLVLFPGGTGGFGEASMRYQWR